MNNNSTSTPERPSPKKTNGDEDGHRKTPASGRTRGVRKPYARRACVPCKKAHAACDNGRPCRRCVVQGIENECVSAERKKSTTPRKPRSRSSSVSVSSLDLVNEKKQSKRRKSAPGSDTTSTSSGSVTRTRSSRKSKENGAASVNVDETFPNVENDGFRFQTENLGEQQQQIPGSFHTYDNMGSLGSIDSIDSSLADLNSLLMPITQNEPFPLDTLSGLHTILNDGDATSDVAGDTTAAASSSSSSSLINQTNTSKSVDHIPSIVPSLKSMYHTMHSASDREKSEQEAAMNVLMRPTSDGTPVIPFGGSSGSGSGSQRSTINFLPYMVSGLSKAANSGDAERIRQAQKHRQQLIQSLPKLIDSLDLNLPAQRKNDLLAQLQNYIENETTELQQAFNGLSLDTGRNASNVWQEEPQTEYPDSNLDSSFDEIFPSHNLQSQMTHIDHNVDDMDLHFDPASQFGNTESSMNFSPLWTWNQPSTNDQNQTETQDVDMMVSSPLTPSSLLNPSMFFTPSDMSSSKDTRAEPEKDVNSQVRQLVEKILALGKDDSTRSLTTRQNEGTSSSSNSNSNSNSGHVKDKHTLTNANESRQHQSTVTLTDMDDGSNDDSIIDLITKSASELQDTNDNGSDILMSLLDTKSSNSSRHQQEQASLSRQHLPSSHSYWIDHSDDDKKEYLLGNNNNNNNSSNSNNSSSSNGDVDNDDGNMNSRALMNYVRPSNNNTAISGDMRMRALDQQSGMNAILQLLNKKNVTVKDIVRQMMSQNRDMHMLRLSQEEDRKTIQEQREEIESLKKKQDSMMNIVLELQKLVLSSGIPSSKHKQSSGHITK